ncbi:hypothetical protein Goshw_003771 [Gossypium schwendimanii]|uniref:Uncharacterized protein n=1 Tax=Gossypium schwendimanii TaxID=34291 RepID=A0A7J9MYE6_GOSSC|nr:hypothetical protein [Gossypium schwendimanii]
MRAGEGGKVDSLNVLSSYLRGSTVTFGRLIKFCIESSLTRRGYRVESSMVASR